MGVAPVLVKIMHGGALGIKPNRTSFGLAHFLSAGGGHEGVGDAVAFLAFDPANEVGTG